MSRLVTGGESKQTRRSSLRSQDTPSRSPDERVQFSPHVQTRQRSAQDENGDSILGTEQYGMEPLNNSSITNFFLKGIIDDVAAGKNVPLETVETRIRAATATDEQDTEEETRVALLKTAKDILVYLNRKLDTLLINGGSIGINDYRLRKPHAFVLERLIQLVHRYIDVHEGTTPSMGQTWFLKHKVHIIF